MIDSIKRRNATINYIIGLMKDFLEDFVCGTVSGVVGCLSSFYLDTIKVHMQVEAGLPMGRVVTNIVRS